MKKYFIGLVLFVLLFAFVACNSPINNETSSDNKLAEQEQNIESEEEDESKSDNKLAEQEQNIESEEEDESKEDNTAQVLLAAKTAAINDINQYAIDNALDVSNACSSYIIGIINAETLLINAKTAILEVEIEKQLCILYIELAIINDWKLSQEIAIDLACDENILEFASLKECYIEEGIYTGTQAQYNSEIAALNLEASNAHSLYSLELQRADNECARLGLTGSGYHELLKSLAAKQRDETLKSVSNRKANLQTLWNNRLLYEECSGLYNYWVGYKYGLITALTAEYNLRKNPVNIQINLLNGK